MTLPPTTCQHREVDSHLRLGPGPPAHTPDTYKQLASPTNARAQLHPHLQDLGAPRRKKAPRGGITQGTGRVQGAASGSERHLRMGRLSLCEFPGLCPLLQEERWQAGSDPKSSLRSLAMGVGRCLDFLPATGWRSAGLPVPLEHRRACAQCTPCSRVTGRALAWPGVHSWRQFFLPFKKCSSTWRRMRGRRPGADPGSVVSHQRAVGCRIWSPKMRRAGPPGVSGELGTRLHGAGGLLESSSQPSSATSLHSPAFPYL